MKRIALFLLLLPSLVSAQPHGGQCGSCVHRKERMCADECELVAPEKSRRCQQQCIAEYCSHQCEKSAPEIQAYLKENCFECQEQQFELCEAHCPSGTPRKRALCQIECSDERCKAPCAAASEPVAEKKENSAARNDSAN